ncbi:LysE family translocator [Chitinimonas lacunae]|uniref:LysE family translocator n=1 Tax=Chitinimonas lacunae TaxID=1963018 RepID=A0ABV8MR59_9NEIS
MLDTSLLPLFLTAVAALVLVPGPDMALILSQSVARGSRAGLWCAFGIALAGLVQTVLVAAGLGALLQTLPALAEAVRWLGVIYLSWLGYQALRRLGQPVEAIVAPVPLRKLWLGAMLNNLLNPKALLFFSLFLPQFTQPALGHLTWQLLTLGLLLTGIALLWNIVLALLAGQLARHLTRLGSGRFGDSLLGVVFLGLAARLAWSGPLR